MIHTELSAAEIARRGEEIYVQSIKQAVEKRHRGKYLAIDIDSGDFELDEESAAADQRLRLRHPNSLFYLMRIGYPAAFRIGAGLSLVHT